MEGTFGKYRHFSSLALMLATSLILLGGCNKDPGLATFKDGPSGFSITAPEGWYMQTGDGLREQANREAVRAGDPRLGVPSPGTSHEVIVRITRYAPGHAPEPNPTVVCTRFELQQFPPGASAENLLRMGPTMARIEEAPTDVELAGRSWKKMLVTRQSRDPAGREVEVVQRVHFDRWTAVGNRRDDHCPARTIR